MIDDSFIRTIQNYFAPLPHVLMVFLFGSVAKNKARSDSDTDLAILLTHLDDDSLNQRLQYMSQLSARLNHDVDLIFLNEAGPVLTGQVLRYGQLLWERDPHQTTAFKARAMIDYVDWLPYKKRLDDAVVKYFRAA